MAEPNVNMELNDTTGYLPLLNSGVQNLGNLTDVDMYNSSENQDMLIDEILSETTSSSVVQKTDSTKEASNSNSPEEHHVESPTTRQGYTFKCVFCDQILSANDNPKLLECLHNTCLNCMNTKLYDQNEGMVNKSQIECPLCTMYSDPNRIIENQFLLEANDDNSSKVADLKCSSCSDDAVATSYCTDCSEFICDNCVQAHQRLKITKDHTIKPKEEGINELNAVSNGASSNLFCSIHPHEKLSLFCETCDKLTCRDCQLIEHREHKYKFTNEIASEARIYISDMLKDVGYKRALLTSAMKVIDDRQTLITEKKQALVKEITQLVVKLTNTINVRGKQLVSKLTEVCDSKQTTLLEKKEALDQLSKMTDHCIEFTQHALDSGSDMALLYSKKQVTEHLKRIKCKRADIPNPEIPVRIHLALDKVPDLIKAMSTIGQIVVDGRIYLSQQSSSPAISMPPHGSPSPSHSRPPQQQSPICSIQQQLQQQRQTSPGFQQAQMPGPPPYPQFPNNTQQQFQQQGSSNMVQNMNQNMAHGMGQNMGQSLTHSLNQAMGPNLSPVVRQNMGLNRMPNMGPPSLMGPNIPMPMGQLNMSRMQRSPLQRAILPRLPQNSMGLNHHHQQQQQVSSSTHPQGMLQDRSNLRHLLQPNINANNNNNNTTTTNATNNAVYVQTGPSVYQAVQPHLAQQYQNRFPGQQQQQPQFRPQQQNPMRMLVPNQSNRLPLQRQMQMNMQAASGMGGPGARWHIPQQNSAGLHSHGGNRSMTLPTINDNFKITLRQQNQLDPKNLPATVTSTIPKTPSPNHVQGRSDTERNLDKFCEDSVKDLMATIAKLDSNGVQVLAEGRQKGGSPHVDSSTGDAGPSGKIKSELGDAGKDDPNEDWCAVCMDGGELVCCDKCPKVFHQYCHIPNLTVEENDTWQCLLCMNFADIPGGILGEKKVGELSLKEKKIAERIVLEMYCQYDPSLPFREIIGPENEDYHSIIKNPMALDTIRQKLNWNTSDSHYRNMEDLIRDVRLMFRNAYTYNPVDSLVYNDAKTLEKFFDEQLEKFLPEYAYESFDDDDIHPPNRKYRRIISD